MAAQELQVTVSYDKYEQRITQLQGYVASLETAVEEYTSMKNRVNEFMSEEDDSYRQMQENVEVRIARVRRAINATNEQIKTLQDVLNNMSNLGSNVSTLLEEGLNLAAGGLFE